MQFTSPSVLLVDDEPALREVLSDVLAPISAAVHVAPTVANALTMLRDHPVDVIVADLCLPGERGTTLLAYSCEHQNDPAVIIITGKPTLKDALEGVHLHASDFLLKPFSPTKLRQSVLRAFSELEERRSVDRNFRIPQNERLQLETLIGTLDACEHETCSHSLRVLEYCFHLVEMAGYPESQIPALARAALLHDIGKIGIPQSILRKPGHLTSEEFAVMKSHVSKGVRILERVPTMRASVPIVLHHHEHYDGTGYPNGVRGEEIPLGARIFAVVDTLDAMTSDRPYRRALSFEDARAEIRRCAGRQFDPFVAELFLEIPATTWEQLRALADSKTSSSEDVLGRMLRPGAQIHGLGTSIYGECQQSGA